MFHHSLPALRHRPCLHLGFAGKFCQDDSIILTAAPDIDFLINTACAGLESAVAAVKPYFYGIPRHKRCLRPTSTHTLDIPYFYFIGPDLLGFPVRGRPIALRHMHPGIYPVIVPVKFHISVRLAHSRHLAVPDGTLDIIGTALGIGTEYQNNGIEYCTHNNRNDSKHNNQFYYGITTVIVMKFVFMIPFEFQTSLSFFPFPTS